VPSLRWLCFLALAACHPAGYGPQPTDIAPLPPLSSSSIGMLIDQQAVLQLTADQLQRLQALDEALSERDAPLERDLRDLQRAQDAPRPHRRRHGGARPLSPIAQDPDGARRIQESLDDNDRRALADAMLVLDVGQRDTANALLAKP
jgi:hypothetical protein